MHDAAARAITTRTFGGFMHTWYERLVAALCASAAARPGRWLLATLLLSLPALVGVGHLRLDTDLMRLLPRTARAAVATRELQPAIGGDSYFALLLEGDDAQRLTAAVETLARRVAALEDVRSVEYRNPVEFIDRYRYLLVPSYYLRKLSDLILDWQVEANPFIGDLIDEQEEVDADARYGEEQDRREIEQALRRLADLPAYHQSADGRLRGMIVRPRVGTTSLGAVRSLFERLQELAHATAAEFGVSVEVGGTLRNKVDEFNVIVADLNRSGWIGGSAILLILAISFGTVRLLPVLLYPLALGLLWAFALVPPMLGALNTISVFLALVMFGMGIDYAIHIVKRFRYELTDRPAEQALLVTYRSTGASVLVSAVTTALALATLALSDFRGFSDFGVIGGVSILMVLGAMWLVMPALLIVGTQWGLVTARSLRRRRRQPAGRTVTALLSTAVLLSGGLAWQRLSFDYDFSRLKADVPQTQRIKERLGEVYATTGTPGAVYLAPDLATLDAALHVLERARDRPGSLIGRIASIRDFAPGPHELAERLALIADIHEETRAAWVRRIDDADRRRWIEEFNAWEPPATAPTVQQVPASLREPLQASDGSGAWVIGVFPNVPRSDGHNAMAFTRELYGLELPAGVRGPAGETPVFGEILMLVTSESRWLVAATFLGVFAVVLAHRRSLRDAFWIMLPLLAGMVLTLGVMAATGIELNFFNVVVIPALLGMGVDHGVHYLSRWRELHGQGERVHAELMTPLTVCTVTTMLGYSGMLFADHQGLHSIGLVACIGLSCVWAAALLLLPGLLDSGWFGSRTLAGGGAAGGGAPAAQGSLAETLPAGGAVDVVGAQRASSSISS